MAPLCAALAPVVGRRVFGAPLAGWSLNGPCWALQERLKLLSRQAGLAKDAGQQSDFKSAGVNRHRNNAGVSGFCQVMMASRRANHLETSPL